MNPNETDVKKPEYDPNWGYYGQGTMVSNDPGVKISKGKVLIVDDEEINLMVLDAYLNKDYDVIKAGGGKEAIEKITGDKPDIVLLDIMMPHVTGYDVCKFIKENESTHFIPVVIVTALSGSDAKVKCIELGADDYLTKPINRNELFARIRSLLKNKKYQDGIVHDKDKVEQQMEMMRKEKEELEKKVQERTEELKKAKISALKDRMNIK
ncbi:MAG: response regulator [Candidatus Methanoperedens sp.]|nr:response regulator [Candidatus Methanoperedens sp.]